MQLHNGQLNIALDLYLGGFDKKKGTLIFIAKQLDCEYGYGKDFLRRLVKGGILIRAGYDEINGKLHEVYELNKELLIDFLKDDPTFKKISTILYDDWKDANPFGAFPVYNSKELKDMEKMIR